MGGQEGQEHVKERAGLPLAIAGPCGLLGTPPDFSLGFVGLP